MTESLLTLAERVANTARRIDELLTQMRAELEAQEQRSIQRREEVAGRGRQAGSDDPEHHMSESCEVTLQGVGFCVTGVHHSAEPDSRHARGAAQWFEIESVTVAGDTNDIYPFLSEDAARKLEAACLRELGFAASIQF